MMQRSLLKNNEVTQNKCKLVFLMKKKGHIIQLKLSI